MSTLVDDALSVIADFDGHGRGADCLQGHKFARVVVALDEAIDDLRMEHDTSCDGVARMFDGSVTFADGCPCGAVAHNDALDRLRAMLDEVTA